MFVIVLRQLFRKNFIGIAIFPFIILRDKNLKNNPTIINHEKIHIIQQLELLIFIFYTWYLIEFIVRLIILKDQHKAYRNISFEKEAYTNEHNLNYLKNRKFYSFINYL